MDFSFLKEKDYDFLKDVKDRIMLLTIGGSHAYGTNVNTPEHVSDIDLRGIMFDSSDDILLKKEPFQLNDAKTDSVIYTFNKIVRLFIECNPNTIELLGNEPEDYCYIHPLGQLLLDNKKAFLSKRASLSFAGYSNQQLNRLENALARDSLSQKKKEEHILNSVKSAMLTINDRYRSFDGSSMKLYIDKSDKEKYDTEIFIDIDLKHYPLRDLNGIWNEFVSIPRQYEKVNHRNRKKDEEHLNKHAMHLIRLYFTLIDILKDGEIRTKRVEEKDLLLDIRNGYFMNSDGTYSSEFFELKRELDTKVKELEKVTKLPEQADMKTIEEIIKKVNRYIIANY